MRHLDFDAGYDPETDRNGVGILWYAFVGSDRSRGFCAGGMYLLRKISNLTCSFS